VERPVDEGVAVAGHAGREDADLAVGDLARRAGVLAGDAARRPALLEEAGLVDDEDRVRLGERLDRVVAHQVAERVGLPAAAAEDGLLPPGAGIARRLGPHPAGLAPLRPEQPVEEQPRRGRDPLLREQRPHRRFTSRSEKAHSSSASSDLRTVPAQQARDRRRAQL
jgi:hypothetical protein